MSEYDWILGLGLAFGLAFFFNHITYKTIISFFAYFTIFIAFMVWIDFLPIWSLIINIMVLIIVIYIEIKQGGNV